MNKKLIVIATLIIAGGWLWGVIFAHTSATGAYGTLGDEAIIVHGADRVLNGEVPHRDFHSIITGGVYYPLAGFFLVFGDSVHTVRWFNFFTAFAIALAVYWMAWPLMRAAAALPVLLFSFFIFPMWPFVSHHWIFLLIALISVGLIIRKRSPGRFIAAGCLTILSASVFNSKAFMLLVVQLFYIIIILRRDPRRWRWLGFYSAGAGVMLILGAAALLISGSWGEFLRQTIIYPIQYYQNFAVDGYSYQLNYIAFIAIGSIILLSVPLFIKSLINDDHRIAYLSLLAIHVGLSISIIYHLEWFHFIQISVVSFILAFSILYHLYFYIREHWFQLAYSQAVVGAVVSLATLGWVLFGAFASIDGYGSNRYASNAASQEYLTPKGTVYINSNWQSPLVKEFPVVSELLTSLFAGKRIFILPYSPGYYYLYNIQNPTPFSFVVSDAMMLEDFEQLKYSLLSQTDAVLFLPASWIPSLDVQGRVMSFIRDTFPYSQSYLDGDVQVFSKYEFEQLDQQDG